MKIKELQLIKFGKFSDYNIKFNNGLNLIFGENEAGKSTILLFIKTMFYGVSTKRGKSGEVKERERIIPWNSDRAYGRIIVSKDDRNIEIYREFGLKPSSDKLTVLDGDTGERYFSDNSREKNIGYELFGMTCETFEKTLWIAQDDVCIQGKNHEITEKLINFLNQGSFSEVSVGQAIERLDKKRLTLKAETKRNAKGEIDRLTDERNELGRKLYTSRLAENEDLNRLKRIDELKQKEKTLEDKTKNIDKYRLIMAAKEKIKRVEQLDSCLRREIQFGNTRQFQLFKHTLSEDTETVINGNFNKLTSLKNDAEILEEEQKSLEKNIEVKIDTENKRRNLFLYFGIVSLIIGVIFLGIGLIFFASYSVIFLVIFAVFMFLGILSLARKFIMKPSDKADSTFEQNKEKLNNIKSEIIKTEDKLKNQLAKFECADLNEFNNALGIYNENKAKIKMCRDLYNEFLGDDDYDVLKSEVIELKNSIKGIDILDIKEINLDERLRMIEESKKKIQAEKIMLTAQIQDNSKLEKSQDLEDNIRNIDIEIEEKKNELTACNIARECLSEVYLKIKSDYTPRLNSKTKEILRKITDGKHEEVKVSEDFSLKLSPDNIGGEVKRAELFSMGTYNQIYLALRLAVAKLTNKNLGLNLFIDDLLMSFDDKRSKATIELLGQMCSDDDYQILLFSCHSRDIELGKNLNNINIKEQNI